MSSPLPKVTESLRRQWTWNKEQMIEEYDFTQSGAPRSPEGKAETDFEIKMIDALLALPLGTKFDVRKIQEDLLKGAQS